MIFKSKKGNVTLYISFFLITTFVVILASIISPLGTNISTKFFVAGQTMINQSNQYIENISDAEIKAELQSHFESASAAAVDNIEILTAIYKYAWVIVVIIVGIILFLYSRMQVERTQQGFV